MKKRSFKTLISFLTLLSALFFLTGCPVEFQAYQGRARIDASLSEWPAQPQVHFSRRQFKLWVLSDSTHTSLAVRTQNYALEKQLAMMGAHIKIGSQPDTSAELQLSLPNQGLIADGSFSKFGGEGSLRISGKPGPQGERAKGAYFFGEKSLSLELLIPNSLFEKSPSESNRVLHIQFFIPNASQNGVDYNQNVRLTEGDAERMAEAEIKGQGGFDELKAELTVHRK
jgi:hypothetical protein